MNNHTEQIILKLTKAEKEYIQECAQNNCLSITQFLLLCALSFPKTQEKSQKDRRI